MVTLGVGTVEGRGGQEPRAGGTKDTTPCAGASEKTAGQPTPAGASRELEFGQRGGAEMSPPPSLALVGGGRWKKGQTGRDGQVGRWWPIWKE